MDLLEKYASIIVNVGACVNENQIVVINSPVDCASLTRLLVKEAYKAKCRNVIVKWYDDIITHEYFLHANDAEFDYIPEWLVEQFHYIVDNNACAISITSPTPGLMSDVNPIRQQRVSKARNRHLSFYNEHMMASKSQWCVAAYPSLAWAEKVFPDLPKDEAVEKLLSEILKCSRVYENSDPVVEWKKHVKELDRRAKILNEFQFKSLHFTNSLGTDITVGLVDNHIWGAGGEYSSDGTYFVPNIPTEEVFTMPDKNNVNGIVYSSKPLNYQGKLIEDFYLEFKDGKVISHGAKKMESALLALLDTDEGSRMLGEVALIGYDSPISKSGILFYNTLFDENASCHLALGNAYPTCIKDGTKISEDELMKLGYNKSMVHVDFMFGTNDLQVVGEKKDGEKVIVFSDGNFVF